MKHVLNDGIITVLIMLCIFVNIPFDISDDASAITGISRGSVSMCEICDNNHIKEFSKNPFGLDDSSLLHYAYNHVIFTGSSKLCQKLTFSDKNITFTKHRIDNNLDYVFGVFACDIDNDGDCDILGAAQEGDEIVMYRNEGGKPINWTRIVIDSIDGATSIFATDIDGDGDIDVVCSAWQANKIAWWRNDGGTPIQWTMYTIRDDFEFAHEAYCYDLDNDGDMDILGASTDDDQIVWWRNDGGTPIAWKEQIICSDFNGAKCARVADFDNDGLLDVIGAAFYGDEIRLWRNCGDSPIVWEEYVITDDFDGSHRVEPCDMDFDGDIDIVGAAYFDGEISWWENRGGSPIRWSKQIITTGFSGACIGLPVDIDEDGDIDILGTAQQAYDVAYFRNDGGNPFEWTKVMIDPFFQGAWPGFICDIDGDTDIDIVAGASWADQLVWWESDLHQQPLKPARPTGPNSGKPGVEYTYTTVTTDPEGSQLFYLFDWGDTNTSGWIGPFESGKEINATNMWSTRGNFEIKVKAKNIQGSESDWSDPLPVSMPFRHLTLIERLIDWFLNLFGKTAS